MKKVLSRFSIAICMMFLLASLVVLKPVVWAADEAICIYLHHLCMAGNREACREYAQNCWMYDLHHLNVEDNNAEHVGV